MHLRYLGRVVPCLLLAGCSADPTGPGDLGAPACDVVSGTAAVTFTLDRGETLAPTRQSLSGVKYTRGLVALTGNRLLAAHAMTVLLTEDAGCTWRQIATLPAEYTPLIAASETRAYGWPEGRAGMYRIEIDGSVTTLAPPGAAIRGAVVSKSPSELLRIADERGLIYESADAGHTWRAVGSPVPVGGTVYTVAFDPKNVDKALAGTSNTGIWYTSNAGRTWTRGQVASSVAGNNHNIFSIAVSPVDAQTVWASGIDLGEEAIEAGSGRHIYVSKDAGRTFTVALSQVPGSGDPPRGGVTIVNGPVLAPDPANANLLYFVFSASFANYGTDIIELDWETRQYRVRHNSYHDVSAIAFAPTRFNTMYLGLGIEQRCDPFACP